MPRTSAAGPAAGMTLVELIAVIALVSILAAVAVPRFEAAYGVRLHAAAKQLAADVRYAQARAIATRVRHGVTFDPAADAYTVYRGDPATPASDPLDPRRPLRRRLEGVSLVSADFDGAARVEFNSLGVPFSAGGAELAADGAAVLAEGGETDTVVVRALTGRVSR